MVDFVNRKPVEGGSVAPKSNEVPFSSKSIENSTVGDIKNTFTKISEETKDSIRNLELWTCAQIQN